MASEFGRLPSFKGSLSVMAKRHYRKKMLFKSWFFALFMLLIDCAATTSAQLSQHFEQLQQQGVRTPHILFVVPSEPQAEHIKQQPASHLASLGVAGDEAQTSAVDKQQEQFASETTVYENGQFFLHDQPSHLFAIRQQSQLLPHSRATASGESGFFGTLEPTSFLSEDVREEGSYLTPELHLSRHVPNSVKPRVFTQISGVNFNSQASPVHREPNHDIVVLKIFNNSSPLQLTNLRVETSQETLTAAKTEPALTENVQIGEAKSDHIKANKTIETQSISELGRTFNMSYVGNVSEFAPSDIKILSDDSLSDKREARIVLPIAEIDETDFLASGEGADSVLDVDSDFLQASTPLVDVGSGDELAAINSTKTQLPEEDSSTAVLVAQVKDTILSDQATATALSAAAEKAVSDNDTIIVFMSKGLLNGFADLSNATSDYVETTLTPEPPTLTTHAYKNSASPSVALNLTEVTTTAPAFHGFTAESLSQSNMLAGSETEDTEVTAEVTTTDSPSSSVASSSAVPNTESVQGVKHTVDSSEVKNASFTIPETTTFTSIDITTNSQTSVAETIDKLETKSPELLVSFSTSSYASTTVDPFVLSETNESTDVTTEVSINTTETKISFNRTSINFNNISFVASSETMLSNEETPASEIQVMNASSTTASSLTTVIPQDTLDSELQMSDKVHASNVSNANSSILHDSLEAKVESVKVDLISSTAKSPALTEGLTLSSSVPNLSEKVLPADMAPVFSHKAAAEYDASLVANEDHKARFHDESMDFITTTPSTTTVFPSAAPVFVPSSAEPSSDRHEPRFLPVGRETVSVSEHDRMSQGSSPVFIFSSPATESPISSGLSATETASIDHILPEVTANEISKDTPGDFSRSTESSVIDEGTSLDESANASLSSSAKPSLATSIGALSPMKVITTTTELPRTTTQGPPKYYDLPVSKEKPSSFPTQTIRTRNGQMKGTVLKTLGGIRVNSFLGIPYAQPPVDAMRFERPVEFPPWTGVFEAKRSPKSCPQPTMQLNGFVGVNISDTSEDCLYLNVWSPFCDGSKKCRSRPVVVYIHGGGYVYGGINWSVFEGAELAARSDMVVVTLNYRLGALGFLYVPSNGGRAERGNMGLYDQHMALRWIKANIKAFGGDHNKITIVGQDAGAVSVGYHILTPRSGGLFKRAVMQSGSPFSFVMRNTKDEGESLFRSLASYTDCTMVHGNSTLRYDDVLSCMKRLPFEKIITASEKFNGRGANSFFPVLGEEFIPMNPKDSLLLKRFSHVDLLVSTAKSEGAFFLRHFLSPFTNIEDVDKIEPGEIVFYLRVFLSALLGGKPTASLNELTQNNEPISHEGRVEFLRNISAVVGDYPFLCATTDFGSEYANLRHNVYHMQFDHTPWFLLHPPWFPATHFDDVMYWTGAIYMLKERSRSDERVADELLAILTSFANKGTPQTRGKLTWPRINQGGYFMNIGSDFTELLRSSSTDCSRWARHYPHY